MAERCQAKTEVYARVCEFFRPVQQWNLGKKEEYRERKVFRGLTGGEEEGGAAVPLQKIP
jgi:ribonucleoside-triphosphate reductase